MVDTRVTEWVKTNGSEHNFKLCGGSTALKDIDLLEEAQNLADLKAPYMIMRKKREFMVSWIRWCRCTARKLQVLTGCEWSARDVEMAVFTAQKNCLPLNSLCGDANS